MSVIQGTANQASTRGFYNFPLEQSLRFNDNDSAYLSWTPSTTPTSDKKFTFSFWMKLGNIGTDFHVVKHNEASNVNQIDIHKQSNNTLNIVFRKTGTSTKSAQLVTNQVFRDPSAWYHIVVSFDSTAGTPFCYLYVNGSQVTSLSTNTQPSANDQVPIFASGKTFDIGRDQFDTDEYMDGYLAEVNFIDGTALDADSFGELKNGVWIPKDPSGLTYGTNGFRLSFADDAEVEAFNTVLWTSPGGDPATVSITGTGFQPDLVWVKNRSSAQSHLLYDSVRGAGSEKELISDLTYYEGQGNAESYGYLSSFDSDGFTFSRGSSGWINANYSTDKWVAWGWKAGGSSNTYNIDDTGYATASAAGLTDGTAPLTGLSVSTTYGFSISTFNSGSSGTQSFAHGLGTTPSLCIFKEKDSGGASDHWVVWEGMTGNPATSYGYLNLTNAFGTDTSQWSNTAPTSTTFTFNSGYAWSTSQNMIAYCWAEKSGYSKFGSYTGNGSTSGPTVTCGFKPAMIILKRTDSGGSWTISDNTRDTANPVTPYLFPHASDAEATDSSNEIDFNDTGFQIKHDTRNNTSGATYIYAAFADTREAAFWLDQSGNDNDWQPVNLDHNDTVADSPTDNFATLNPLDKGSGITLSDGNLTITSTAGDSHSVRGTMALGEGQWYFEFTLDSFGGGIQPFHWGIAKNNASVTDWVSGGDYIVMEDNGALKVDGGSVSYYSGGFVAGDVIGVAVDVTNDSITFYKNGTSLGAYSYTIESGEYLPYVGDGSGVRYGVTTANFGQQPFKYDPPE